MLNLVLSLLLWMSLVILYINGANNLINNLYDTCVFNPRTNLKTIVALVIESQ